MATATRMLLLFVIYVVVNGVTMIAVMATTGKTDAPIFIFGDSTADVGTNNHLETCTARADHRYHGIDFPYSMPTGRYSNGKNSADQIARLLGDYKLSPPPFLSLLVNKATFKRNLLRGANFASAGAGIFRQTGVKHFNKVICLEDQILQFATVRDSITEVLGSPNTDDLIQNSIYIISVGSNDVIEYTVSQHGQPGDPEQLIANLTEAYAAHITHLYELGARKFGIIGLPPIGCAPAARVFNRTTGGCFDVLNDNSRSFYTSMKSLLMGFGVKFNGFKYSLGDVYTMTMNVIDNPRANGFKDGKTPCCGSGADDCIPGAKLCTNRGDFLFWDRFHPTEKGSELAALTLVYGEGPEYVTPMNFSSLAMA